jgi:hypothetical protein
MRLLVAIAASAPCEASSQSKYLQKTQRFGMDRELVVKSFVFANL